MVFMQHKHKFQSARGLSLAFVFFAFMFGSIAPARMQESTGRERLAPRATQTPTPKSTASPKISPTPTPKTSPTPAATPTPVAAPAPRIQSFAELQSQIRSVLLRPELARARVGVKILSLDTGKTVFEENADKYFMPASNMKSFTVAAAMDRLSPNFRFVTSVYAPAPLDASGTIRGDVVIYGRGDPSIAASFNNGDYYQGLNNLVDKIAAAGVKRIEGNLIGDESYFTGDSIGSTWEWDDLQWYYGAEISALTVNDNSVDLFVKPTSVGAPAAITLGPQITQLSIVNLTRTAASGTRRNIEVRRPLGSNVLEVSGTIPVGGDYSGAIAAPRPAEVFVSLLKNLLQQKGIIVTGQTRTIDARGRALAPLDTAKVTEIARLESVPFSLIAAKTLKPSQNLYTELILRTLGENFGDKSNPAKTSAQRGAEVVQKFLAEAGVAPDAVVQWDGSGLSRHDLITPNAAAQVYAYMSRHRYALSWREALTIAGVDGTLKNRFKNTAAEGNVRGKTGTIDQVSTLSGYLTTASGERMAFSILVNNLPAGSSAQRAVIDDIVLSLVNFNGKSPN